MSYSGHLTCESCEMKLETDLREIADRYEKLDPRPSGMQAPDGQPRPLEFESKAPASDFIIAMMDPRSSEVAKVWVAADRRVHQESERPPLSVYTMLLREVYEIAEQREMSLPDPCERVRHLTDWLLRHVEWVTRQDSVIEFREIVTLLTRQLRPATGEKPRRPFASCPTLIGDSNLTCPCECHGRFDHPCNVEGGCGHLHGQPCGGPLFGPATISSSVIRCHKCGGAWERGKPSVDPSLDEWEHLGTQLGKRAA